MPGSCCYYGHNLSPLLVAMVHRDVVIQNNERCKELEIPAHVFVLVRYATSVTNPVLYTLFRRDFQTALKFLFKIKRFKRRSRASDAETLEIKHRH